MDKCKLKIIDAANIQIGEQYVNIEKWEWVFLGTDTCTREKIIERLGTVNRFCYARELQEISINYRDTYLDWLAHISMKQDQTIWWSTNIAYKSPYTSDLFLNHCYLGLVKKWIDTGVKNRIVLVENPWVLKSCLLSFRGTSADVIVNKAYFLKVKARRYLMSFARLFFQLYNSLKLWIGSRAYLLLQNDCLMGKASRYDVDILSITWVEDRSFDCEGKYSDPYIGILHKYYQMKGLKVLTTTLPIFPYRLLKKVYACRQVVPLVVFMKFTDIMRACLHSLLFKCNKENVEYDGLVTAPLFHYEMIYEKGQVFCAVLHYLTCLRIFKSNAISFRILLYPFENQPWDKMMVLAQKHAKAKFKSIGCHNIGVPYFYLNFFLGHRENVLCPQPDIIASNGSYWAKVLRDAGFSCDIRNGGSLRFGSGIGKITGNTKPLQSYHVLVLFSASLNYSLDLMFYMLRTSRSENMYYIKPHPDTPAEIIQKYTGLLPKNFRFVSGAMDEWMDKVGYAIHVGTNAAIECMMNGIKVFKYLPERIDLDPLLGLGFEQDTVSDKDILDYSNNNISKIPNDKLIAEPFNKEMWDGIL